MRIGNLNTDLSDDPRGGVIVNGLEREGNPLLGFSEGPNFQARWIKLKAGERKAEAHSEDDTQALVILIKGCHEVSVGEKKLLLQNEGDYIHLIPGDMHSWEAKEDTLLVVIKWPKA